MERVEAELPKLPRERNAMIEVSHAMSFELGFIEDAKDAGHAHRGQRLMMHRGWRKVYEFVQGGETDCEEAVRSWAAAAPTALDPSFGVLRLSPSAQIGRVVLECSKAPLSG
jgi:hypothetical protein